MGMWGAFWALFGLLGVAAAADLTTIVVNSTLHMHYNNFVNSSVEIVYLFSDAKEVSYFIFYRAQICVHFFC